MPPCGGCLGRSLIPLGLVQRVHHTLKATKSSNLRLQQLSSTGLAQISDVNETVNSPKPRWPQRSKAYLKRLRRSPSEALVKALEAAKHDFAIPRKRDSHKVDLSYVNPRTYDRQKFKSKLVESRSQPSRRQNQGLPSLQAVLVDYMQSDCVDEPRSPSRHSWQALTRGLLEDKHHDLLAARGYTIDDVEDWHSILTTRDVNSAARLLLHHSPSLCPANVQPKKPLPTFVLLFFVRRETVSASALRSIILYAWQELHRMECQHKRIASDPNASERSSKCENHFAVLDDASVFLLVARLFRLARVTWPEALITIAAMAVKHIGFHDHMSRSSLSHKKSQLMFARFTDWYNKMLSFLAMPASLSPFHSVVFYQRSQFDLIQRMAEHKPPLAITREGYRAIVSVQLRNIKTANEIEWAQLKAMSWPPWKEDKTGLDAEKGPEDGVSRALQALRRAREAGYGDLTWEKTASILAGWDVDGSPTIQTRALLFHKLISPQSISRQREVVEPLTSSKDTTSQPAEWAARIRTTRTIQEAWACFLAYGDCHHGPDEGVYFAMLSKIIQTRDDYPPASQSDSPHYIERPFVAGDSPAPLPIPDSPKEMTYVRTQPPSFDEFVNTMFEDKINPKGPKLAYLLTHAQSLSHGLKYIELASNYTQSLKSLLKEFPEIDEQILHVPQSIFRAYVYLLVRFSDDIANTFSPIDYDPAHLDKINMYGESPLIFAIRLLKIRQPLHLSPWHSVLAALSPSDALGKKRLVDTSQVAQYIHRYSHICHLLSDMRNIGLAPNLETFNILAKALKNVIAANMEFCGNKKIVHRQEDGSEWTYATMERQDESTSDNRWSWDSSLLNQFAKNLDDLFAEVLGHSHSANQSTSSLPDQWSKENKFPTLLAVPQPWALHSYVCVLGLQCKWHKMLELLDWMVAHQREIAAATEMPRNGPKLFRRVLVATRVYMERSWTRHGEYNSVDGCWYSDRHSTEAAAAAPDDMIERARQLICRVEAWRGWPSDDEVELYCKHTNFPRQRRTV